jgi:hypothetical protein
MTDYTHTRITTEYLAKLHKLAEANKRSATKQLEVAVDQAAGAIPVPTLRKLAPNEAVPDNGQWFSVHQPGTYAYEIDWVEAPGSDPTSTKPNQDSKIA